MQIAKVIKHWKSEQGETKQKQTEVCEHSLGCLKHLENKGRCCLHEPSH